MSWEIVVGIGNLIGFLVGAFKLIIPLANSLTTLTKECERLNNNMEQLKKENNQKEKEIKDLISKLEADLKENRKEINNALEKLQEDRVDGTKRIWETIEKLEDTIQKIELQLAMR